MWLSVWSAGPFTCGQKFENKGCSPGCEVTYVNTQVAPLLTADTCWSILYDRYRRAGANRTMGNLTRFCTNITAADPAFAAYVTDIESDVVICGKMFAKLHAFFT